MTRIAVASLPLTACLDDSVGAVTTAVERAAALGADILCTPEACLPGHRCQPGAVPHYPQGALDAALAAVADAACRHRVTTLVGTEQVTSAGREIACVVIDRSGAVLGHQAKTQLAPVEDGHYVPGRGRSVFTASGVTFGIAICTEGFRYPETVRWAARAGAQVVFHPHFEGSSTPGSPPRQWCDPGNSYHEKAVVCRAVENAVYVASCNYALADQRSATCVVDPEGGLAGRLGYGEAGVLAQDIDLARATREIALRYAPERFSPR